MISKIRASFFVLFSPFVAETSFAFSNNDDGIRPPKSLIVSSSITGVLSSSSLNMGYAIVDDDDWFQMQSAQECATSDTCSLEEATKSFDNVMRIQRDCAKNGDTNSPVCENAATSAELVALLRQKIKNKLSTTKSITNLSAISLAAILCLSSFVIAGTTGNVPIDPDVIPFTPQEWFWAARDGYLPVMLEQYFKYGGLSNMDHTYDMETSPFTIQELWWSIKGGYLNHFIDHFYKHGGLVSSDNYHPPADSTFLTQQEWYWSVRDGYFGEMTKQNFYHGGLSTNVEPIDIHDDGTNVIPMTPQEIRMAIRGGYMNDLFSHHFRNGGL